MKPDITETEACFLRLNHSAPRCRLLISIRAAFANLTTYIYKNTRRLLCLKKAVGFS